MASGPEGLEPLKYQTWELKVSIHCEGCKKKVKKVLQGVEGVYSIAIDSKQNKVTVTGDVDVETITRRFRKYGKHAELWPERKPYSSNNSSCSADADTDAEAKGKEKSAAGPKTEEQQADNEKKKGPEVPPENTVTPESAAGAVKPTDNIAQKKGSDEPAESEKNEAEKPAPPSEDPSDAGADEEENKGNNEVNREESSGDEGENLRKAAAGGRAIRPYSSPTYTRPVYTMSYSSSYPSTSNAYYAVPPPAMPSVYVHSIHPPPATYLPEYYPPETYYGSMEPPPESYDMFNDENPNACSVM